MSHVLGELGNPKNRDRHLKSGRSGRGSAAQNARREYTLDSRGAGLCCGFADTAGYREVRHEDCAVKGMDMIRIECEFMANFAIPDYLGLGKSVPRGLGLM